MANMTLSSGAGTRFNLIARLKRLFHTRRRVQEGAIRLLRFHFDMGYPLQS